MDITRFAVTLNSDKDIILEVTEDQFSFPLQWSLIVNKIILNLDREEMLLLFCIMSNFIDRFLFDMVSIYPAKDSKHFHAIYTFIHLNLNCYMNQK